MLSDRPLSYQSKLQSTIALLSYKVEYMVTTEVRKKALWVVKFLVRLGFCFLNQLVNLCTDNKGAISLTDNLKFH